MTVLSKTLTDESRKRYIELVLLASLYLSEEADGQSRFKSPEIPRVRKDIVKDIFTPLGPRNFRRAYRMRKATFYRLHTILESDLKKHFFPKEGGKRSPGKSTYLINTKMRLSMALRFFAGGSPLDIMLNHGVSFSSVFTSVWGVVDCVNRSEALRFQFPSTNEQELICNGFKSMSGASFANVIGVIMVRWYTHMDTEAYFTRMSLF